ncbi:MAG: iron-containing alcohol dehydrogenase [Verrucomicrobiales bacterium]
MSGSLSIDGLLAAAGADDASQFVARFAHAPGTQVHFGLGAIGKIGSLARQSGCSKALVVTDPGIEDAGHLDKVLGSLRDLGVAPVLFDQVIENPTTETVDACLAVAQAGKIDGIIGVGGGSSMDTAKGCNFLISNGGRMQDYWGIGKAKKSMLPLLVIPTTAGTGSECQSFALISDARTHQKMACGDKKAAAMHAILDPELTLTQPPRVAAVTGIDALAHAVESAVSSKRSEVSYAYSKTAFRLLSRGFPRIIKTPGDITARGMMQLGAAFAGVAIENSMLGAAHAAANPLTAHFDVVHGIAVGVMLPEVIRHNKSDEDSAGWYCDLYPGDLASLVRGFLVEAELPARLSQCQVDPSDFPMLAREAAQQWTARFNPVAVSERAFLGLYEAAWGG